MTDRPFDAVLHTDPPAFSGSDAASIAADLFGVRGTATSIESERDQTFAIDASRPAVMKISNVAEDPVRLDLEARAVLMIADVDPGLPVTLPWEAIQGTSGEGLSRFRAGLAADDGAHWVRMYDWLPGTASVEEASLSDAAIKAWGGTVARLGRAMRGLSDPTAMRTMLWDPQHALLLRDLLEAMTDVEMRGLVQRALDRFEQVVTPIWPQLRQQVIHGDLTGDNTLVDEEGTITGIIDFGDMSFTALMVDIVSVIEALVPNRSGEELFRVARLAIDGFEQVVPLEPMERAVMAEVLAARTCAAAVVPVWRAHMYHEPDALMPKHRQDAYDLLSAIDDAGFDEANRLLGGREPGTMVAFDDLLQRRTAVLGSALTELSYDEPLHITRGEGPWLFDADGVRYLDAYNNVPVVGHCHPRVTGAIARQARALNTNMRYLHESVLELAERLVATTDGALDTVMFVNSGSEANDLAWRIALAATGNSGGLCTSWAYHGVSEAITAFSPEVWPNAERPAHIETWEPPDLYRGTHLNASSMTGAIERLAGNGYAPAVAILDGVLTSDGILSVDPELARQWVDQVHAAGGLWIADEVQGGYGRTGEAMWSYQRTGITPDFVTLGKPMGNGHPVAAVITRSDIVDRFSATTDYFSTFGGNPVATASALAVLDVIEDERILHNARTTGEYLRGLLGEVQAGYPDIIGDVRGMGLATGVEIVSDPSNRTPDPDRANDIMNGLRRRGVLVGTTGREGNTLKVRPPLVLAPAQAELLTETLRKVLAEIR